ncbi:hypothetical protein LPJ63_004014, partial [Coemansia sp. RSA 2711]
MNTAKRVFDGSRAGQKIAANIYTSPIAAGGGGKRITLLLAHANGFHKELWEPTLERMFQRASPGDYHIAQAVALDGYNHGDSAILNRASISGEHESPWFLHARDILAVVRQLNVPNIIGIGHSWGASSLLLAEILEPRTFAALVATDPVLMAKPDGNPTLRDITLKRRFEWADERAARAYFEPHPFFKIWHPRILDLYITHGIERTVESKLVLKCRPVNEAAVYAGAFSASPYATKRLAQVQCPTAFLTGEISGPSPPT